MIKKLFILLFKPKNISYIDAKLWVQKILLEEKFKKYSS